MEYALHLLVMICIFGALSSAANIDGGFVGIVSFAYAAIFGASAYATACLLEAQPNAVAVALGGAIVTGIVANLAVGALAGRLAAGDFAVATLAAHGLFGALISNTNLVRGPMGMQIKPVYLAIGNLGAPATAATAGLALLAASIALAQGIRRTSLGRALRVIREDPVLALSLGIDERTSRILAIGISGSLCGAAGFLFAGYVQFVHPDSFTTREAILIVCMAIAGGLGNPWGALAGAVLLVILPELLRWIGLPASSEGPMRDVLYGSLLAALVLLRPLGLFGRFVPGAHPQDVSIR